MVRNKFGTKKNTESDALMFSMDKKEPHTTAHRLIFFILVYLKLAKQRTKCTAYSTVSSSSGDSSPFVLRVSSGSKSLSLHSFYNLRKARSKQYLSCSRTTQGRLEEIQEIAVVSAPPKTSRTVPVGLQNVSMTSATKSG